MKTYRSEKDIPTSVVLMPKSKKKKCFCQWAMVCPTDICQICPASVTNLGVEEYVKVSFTKAETFWKKAELKEI